MSTMRRPQLRGGTQDNPPDQQRYSRLIVDMNVKMTRPSFGTTLLSQGKLTTRHHLPIGWLYTQSRNPAPVLDQLATGWARMDPDFEQSERGCRRCRRMIKLANARLSPFSLS